MYYILGKQPWNKATISFVMVLVFLLIFLLLALPPFVYFVTHHEPSNNKLGVVNDTIIVGTYNSFWFSRVSVSECIQHGDYAHENFVGVVNTSSLNIHSVNTKLNWPLFYQRDPLTTTGIIEYVYLLEGSSIDYRICLASTLDSTDSEQGTLFIFNDNIKRNVYTDYPDLGQQLSVYWKRLEIGVNNKTVCTDVKYKVKETAYYFLAAETPGSIVYSYDSTIHQLYLSKDDFETICTASWPTICEINIPGSFFDHRDFDILAYIKVPMAANPITTHLCITSHFSTAVIALTALSGIIAMVCVLLILSLFCFYFVKKYSKNRNRVGYEKL